MTSINISITGNEAQEILLALLNNEFEIEGAEQQPSSLIVYPSVVSAVNIEQYLQDNNYNYTKEEYEPKNWNAVWESNFEPVVVGDFCAVRAHFHETILMVEHEIVITPKMSFGTGHHATTYQVIQQMRGIDFVGKRIVDYGTGTGVLAILAEKLGGAFILAIDNDDWSIDNTKENLAVNDCAKIKVEKAEKIIGADFDIVLANINKNILLAEMENIMKSTAKGGKIIFSGVLTEDKADMEKSIRAYKPNSVQYFDKDNWMAIVVHK